MELTKKRILIGKKGKGIFNTEGPTNLGKLDVLFEQINGEIFEINEKEFFCETKQVFVTSNFNDIDILATDFDLLVIEATPTVQDWKEGDCRYVTIAQKVTPNNSRKSIIQVISSPLPSANERLFY